MVGTYNSALVVLSVIVAILASYVSFDLASRVVASEGRTATRYWLVGGALSMGSGIWAMHFIGMLAMSSPPAGSYDIRITLLSLLIAVGASALALRVVSRRHMGRRALLVGAALVGLGIAGMHYCGMAAMRLSSISYDPTLVALSIVIAICGAAAGLWSAFRYRLDTLLKSIWKKAGSAAIMGGAICGMHYTGMAAAKLVPVGVYAAGPHDISNAWLAIVVFVLAFAFLGGTLLAAAFDAYLAERSKRHAKSLIDVNAALKRAQDELESRVAERTAELARTTQSLRDRIAERGRADERIRESERRFSDMLANVALISVMLDRDARITYCNDYLLQRTGWRADEVIGRSWFERFSPPELVDELRGVHADLIADRPIARHHDNEIVTRTGERLLVRWSNTVLRSASGDEVIGSASIGEDITERHRVDQAMQSLAAQLRALSRRLVDVRESERRQLARELHDRVGQNLTALGLDLGILRAKLDAHGDPEIRLRLEESARLLDDTADAIENVLSDLRPPMLDDYGLLTALQWYANNFFKRTGIPVEVRGDELGTRPPANIEIALFRVAQEALTNIAKHAGATRVIIELERSPEEVVMSIIDNGVGFDASSAGNAMAKRGLGMVTMRERCEAVGGRFEVISAPNAGTTIIARIPC